MVLCYDKRQKCLQAGIHTQAHFHDLTIKVRERGQSADLQSMNLEHEHIKATAPLFLYVEKKGDGAAPDGAATLYKPDDPSYRQAFANVLDLQSEPFHKRDRLRIKPDILAPLNILNGEFYSATLGKATRTNSEGDLNPHNLGLVGTGVAGDISNTSGNLILRSKDHKARPLIQLPLSDEKHYEVTFFNEPAESDHTQDHDHSGHGSTRNGEINHFNVYYEALVLKEGAMKYKIEIEEDHGSTQPDSGPIIHFEPFDPPCDIVRVSGIPRLPDWS
jgi:hypothetical protein